jgi:hypothetical protein
MRQQLLNHQLKLELPEQSQLKQEQCKLRIRKIQKKKFQPEKLKNTIGGFSLENELNKIKIPMPLFEFEKNSIYKKRSLK